MQIVLLEPSNVIFIHLKSSIKELIFLWSNSMFILFQYDFQQSRHQKKYLVQIQYISYFSNIFQKVLITQEF